MEFVDDPYNNLSQFITFDVGLCCTPSSLDHFLPYYSYSPALPVSYASLASTPISIETLAASANALFAESERSSLNEEEDEIIDGQNEDEVNVNVCSSTNNRSRSGDHASTSSGLNTVIGTVPMSSRLPGRVFTSGRPEWTSNVVHYSHREHLRVHHAIGNKYWHGSLAMPISDPSDKTCCGVFEVVTVKKKSNFDKEMKKFCTGLQDVNLVTTTTGAIQPKYISNKKKNVLVEISEVLKSVCQSHRLPLALIWIPAESSSIIIGEFSRTCLKEKNMLCMSDKNMKGFVKACTQHYIKAGQGIAGEALQSNDLFFSPDVNTYDITHYPLVHHAREHSLNAALAIRMKSGFTGMDDYIVEFFLPINCTRSSAQQKLLKKISSTMQRVSKNLRTISDAELVGGQRAVFCGKSSRLVLQGECSRPVLQGESSRPAFQTIPSNNRGECLS